MQKDFLKKTSRIHNRPCCSLEGAYLRQNRPPIIPVRDHCPPGRHRALRGCGKQTTSEALPCVSLQKKGEARGRGWEGGCWPAKPPWPPSSNDIPPGTAGRRLQAPGASSQPLTGLGSHSPGARHLPGGPAARPGSPASHWPSSHSDEWGSWGWGRTGQTSKCHPERGKMGAEEEDGEAKLKRIPNRH